MSLSWIIQEEEEVVVILEDTMGLPTSRLIEMVPQDSQSTSANWKSSTGAVKGQEIARDKHNCADHGSTTGR